MEKYTVHCTLTALKSTDCDKNKQIKSSKVQEGLLALYVNSKSSILCKTYTLIRGVSRVVKPYIAPSSSPKNKAIFTFFRINIYQVNV